MLTTLADSFFSSDGAAYAAARTAIEQALGPEAVVDCAGVLAIFNAVVKIADATGIPLEEYKEEVSRDFRADLGIDDYR